MTAYVCWHPELGFLRFASYSQATGSPEPDPRGLFSVERFAKDRQERPFWVNRTRYDGLSIEVKHIHLTWSEFPSEGDFKLVHPVHRWRMAKRAASKAASIFLTEDERNRFRAALRGAFAGGVHGEEDP